MIHGRCYLCGDRRGALVAGLCPLCAPGREVWEAYLAPDGDPMPEQPRRTTWWA